MPPAGSTPSLRSNMKRLRANHSYGYVLGLIVVSFVFAAAAPDADWSSSTLLLLECATLVVALWTSGVAGTSSKLSLALIALSLATAVALVVWGGKPLAGAVGLLSAALTCATVVAIVLGVLDQDEVNRQVVVGAVCIYILLGFAFVYLYGALAVLGHGDLFAQGTDGTRATRLYFSYVTLTTLGYGDYTMAHNFGRALATLEGLLGPLYLVTVVTLLVTRMRPKRFPAGG